MSVDNYRGNPSKSLCVDYYKPQVTNGDAANHQWRGRDDRTKREHLYYHGYWRKYCELERDRFVRIWGLRVWWDSNHRGYGIHNERVPGSSLQGCGE